MSENCGVKAKVFKIQFWSFQAGRINADMEISQYYIVMSLVVTWFLTTLELLEGQDLHSFSRFVAPSIISMVHCVFHVGCSEAHWQWLSQCFKLSVQLITFRVPQSRAFDSFVYFSVPALKAGMDVILD